MKKQSGQSISMAGFDPTTQNLREMTSLIKFIRIALGCVADAVSVIHILHANVVMKCNSQFFPTERKLLLTDYLIIRWFSLIMFETINLGRSSA